MVSKGEFITAANPWATQFRVIFAVELLLAAFFLLLGFVMGSWILAVLAVLWLVGLGLTWSKPSRIVREVRIYENGLERSMGGKQRYLNIFLPWSAVEGYRWEGNVLRFQWSEHAFLLFRGNEAASSQKLDPVKAGFISDIIRLPNRYSFPTEVQIPAVYTSTVQSILTQAGQR
jgi:hypothetical protein